MNRAAFHTILLFTSYALLYERECEAHAFCLRAVASRSCPQAATIDNIDLEAYLGRWYEIGTTASFKLLTESGLRCNQALYTSSAGKLSLVNSGLQVIDGAAQVRGVNLAAGGVCSGARQACYQLEAAADVSQALKAVNATQSADQLASSVEAAALRLHKIAGALTHIQLLTDQISQANVSSLPSTISQMKALLKEARTEQRHVAGIAAQLSEIGVQLLRLCEQPDISVKTKQQLEQASKTVTSIAAKVKASSASMKMSLSVLKAQASSLGTTGTPIKKPYVYSVTGTITQPNASSAAKLEVIINGMKAPYWIIALEKDSKGDYSAAMVYACREDMTGGSAAATTLFILSREPQLDPSIMHGFLSKAQSMGIYSDCENPFLLTLQRGGTCGRPPSTSFHALRKIT